MSIFHDMAVKHRARREYWRALVHAETYPDLRAAQIGFMRAAHVSFIKCRRIARRFER